MIRHRKALFIALGLALGLAVCTLAANPNLFDALLRVLRLTDSSCYDSHIRAISKRHGVDFHLVKAIIKAESKFNHLAVSRKGAMGLMQMMPVTADQMGILNPFNPEENIDGGVRYLKRLLQTFDNDLKLALAAYNAGPDTVKRYKGVPPYAETHAYLKKVLQFYSEYKSQT